MWGAIWAAIKGLAVAIGWAKQSADQTTGAKLQAAQTTSDNLSVVKAELAASVNAPKTEADVLKRLGEGSA